MQRMSASYCLGKDEIEGFVDYLENNGFSLVKEVDSKNYDILTKDSGPSYTHRGSIRHGLVHVLYEREGMLFKAVENFLSQSDVKKGLSVAE